MTVNVMKDVVLFGADTSRSRAYLSLLLQNNLRPASCVLLSPPEISVRSSFVETELFDNTTPLKDSLCTAEIEVIEVITNDINSLEAVMALDSCPQSMVIFSAAAGALAKDPLFSTGKQFLHVHPGKLPKYRGSTAMYYSLLIEEKIWVSALLLNPEIDQGPVVDEMEATVPSDCSQLDHIYEPLMRSKMLVQVLKKYQLNGKLEIIEQNSSKVPAYYVIHPLLKHIAILSQ